MLFRIEQITKSRESENMKEKKTEKEFMNLISSLNETQLEEFYEELYPSDLEKDLEQECIDYFEWNNDNPKRQKEMIKSLEQILGVKE